MYNESHPLEFKLNIKQFFLSNPFYNISDLHLISMLYRLVCLYVFMYVLYLLICLYIYVITGNVS